MKRKLLGHLSLHWKNEGYEVHPLGLLGGGLSHLMLDLV